VLLSLTTARHIAQLVELNGRLETLTTKLIVTLEITAASMSRLSEQVEALVSVAKIEERLREVEMHQAGKRARP
jgi:hypothetical protein